MKIDADFAGGNVKIVKVTDNEAWLEPDLSDTSDKWFYFNFRVRGAAGKTVIFRMGGVPYGYVSPFGPAVSSDGAHYAFCPEKTKIDAFSFRYGFGADEDEKYFAFSLPYTAERFYDFAAKNGFEPFEFARSEQGRIVPALRFGAGEETVLFTCRHHCCESVASYVLEGALTEIRDLPISKKFGFLVVPMVDIDGVENGDQGKNRIPHDHNRDYLEETSLYASVRAIKNAVTREKLRAFCDFHDPWNYGGENDNVQFVYGKNPDPDLDRLASILERLTAGDIIPFCAKNGVPLGVRWNQPSPNAKDYCVRHGAEISVSIETPYFGLVKPEEEDFRTLGKKIARAFDEYFK